MILEMRDAKMFTVMALYLLSGSLFGGNGGGVVGQYSMRLHLTPGDVVVVGGRLEVSCNITNWQPDRSMFVVWLRRSHGTEVELGTNENVADVLRSRYSARKELRRPADFTRVTYYLTITDLRSYDSGEIVCRIPNQLEVVKNFTVLMPVSSLQLMSEMSDGSRAFMYADQQPIILAESELRLVRCIVNGSYPQPKVAMYVGDDDITDQFVADVELVRDGVTPYFRELYYRTQLTNAAFRIRQIAHQ